MVETKEQATSALDSTRLTKRKTMATKQNAGWRSSQERARTEWENSIANEIRDEDEEEKMPLQPPFYWLHLCCAG